MKKLVSILVSLAMIMCLSISAFATNLTINGERTYTAHKLLNVTTSLKADDACGGAAHTEACYNYAYTINEDYRDVLAAQAGVAADADEAIIAYLRGLDDAAMRAAADALKGKIEAADIDGATVTSATTTIEEGYWLFIDATTVSGNNAKSSVLVNTAGKLDLVINPKVGMPTVTKEVLEVDDTAGTSAWQNTATHDITDTVSFRLTAKLHEMIDNYATYKLVFHDTLSAGLTLVEGSVEVTAGGDDVTAAFTTSAVNAGAFTIGCDDIKAIAGLTVTEDTEFVVTYNATLGANAVIAGTGNPNTVVLEFSNDPYSNSTGTTEEATVTVYTYKLTVDKVDGEDRPLPGATFKLEKLVKVGGADTYVEVQDKLVVGNDGTQFVWTGLDAGTYKLTEVNAPAGYNKVGPQEIIIVNDNAAAEVVNSTGAILPETGAEGTFMLITGGTLLVVLAAVFMITRKKMSIYED